MNFSSLVDRSTLENTLHKSSIPPPPFDYSQHASGGKIFLENDSGVASSISIAGARNASWHSLNGEKKRYIYIYICKRKEKKGNSKKHYFELSRDVHRNPSGARFLSHEYRSTETPFPPFFFSSTKPFSGRDCDLELWDERNAKEERITTCVAAINFSFAERRILGGRERRGCRTTNPWWRGEARLPNDLTRLERDSNAFATSFLN